MRMFGFTNFVPLILPFLNQSYNWHVRDELLNVLMICFLKSRGTHSLGDFDVFAVTEVILNLLEDQKERVRHVALEALATYYSVGNKFSIKEIVNQLVDKTTYDVITDRFQIGLFPYLDDEGVLCLPYLDQIEMMINMSSAGPAGGLPSLPKAELGQGYPQKINSSNLTRGRSSGRHGVLPSSSGGPNTKRTVSASQRPLEELSNNQQ